jgi:hypothetical protein
MNPQVVQVIKKEHKQCFRCGNKENLEIHHAIYTRNKRFQFWLDMNENLIMLCHNCNVNQKGLVENFEFRNLVYNWKARNGYDLNKWLNSIPLKVKDQFYMMSEIYYKRSLEILTYRRGLQINP